MTVVPIFLYHSVCTDPAPWIAPYTVTPETFSRQVEAVAASGRSAMTVSQLRSAVLGLAPMPPRPVLITFDDGFADFHSAAAVLSQNSLPATLYVTTGALRGRGARPDDMAIPPASMLHRSQLPELSEMNVEIGAHTHTHPQLDTLSTRAVMNELLGPKEMLEDVLGRQVSSFAYPHGFHSGRIRRAVQGAGYSSACAVMNALSSDADCVFTLARLTVRTQTTLDQFNAWLAGTGASVAPYPEQWRTTAWRLYRRARRGKGSLGVIKKSVSA